jgi:archaemetzincin
MQPIRLVPVGNIDSPVLEWLAVALRDSLKVECSIHGSILDPADSYHQTRQQYHSTALLAKLLQLELKEETKILGVADVDLFIPILTFVYGEAQLANRAAVVSVHRLRQQFYGLPPDDGLFYERCEKEALHELGHTFGLVHCKQFDCLMHFSNSIEQIDLKSNAFCEVCTSQLQLAP